MRKNLGWKMGSDVVVFLLPEEEVHEHASSMIQLCRAGRIEPKVSTTLYFMSIAGLFSTRGATRSLFIRGNANDSCGQHNLLELTKN